VAGKYPGCHGFEVLPQTEGLRLGWTEDQPPHHADVVVVDEFPRLGGSLLWRSDWPAEGGREAVWEEAWQSGEGTIRFVTGHRPAVEVNATSRTITIESADVGRYSYALAGSGVVTLAQYCGALVLHACAARQGEDATVICARSGSGKSSLLLALAQAGWTTLSDDHCTIYRNGHGHTIWPGPEWLRLGTAQVPSGLSHRFSLPWKDAWDLSPWHSRGPARVSRLVVMQPPGGEAAQWQPLTPAEAVPLLSDHAVWLLAPQDRGRVLFPQTVAIAAGVPAYRMRLPRRSNWAEQAVSLLSQTS